MIAKGASRSGPRQLAVYLMRVERWATGEPVVLLEFQSPWGNGLNFAKGPDDIWRMSNPILLQPTAEKLIEGFRDWQILSEGTKQGRDGLYHAEISPAPEYADTMTSAQWKRAADILGEELGLQNQPRAVVLHGGTDGRKHMHIVWQRTDVDTMKVVSDAYNYVAHEKASHRMEREFGHEFVPGKHAKRDRKKQEEFPRQKLTQDEDQYQKRTGLSKEERIEQITALRAAADSGQAFKAALEEAGYVLAQGEQGYIVVDQKGGHSVLTRNTGLKKKDLEAFMAGVELDKLPTIEEAKALQAERRRSVSKRDVSKSDISDVQPPVEKQLEEREVEASKSLQDQTPEKQPEPAQPQEGAELEALKKALAERQAKDWEKWATWHAHELRQLEFDTDHRNAEKLADRDAADIQQMQALKDQIREGHTGIKGILDAIENRWNPGLGAEKAKQRRRKIAQLRRRQAKERKDYAVLLEQVKQEEIAVLKERHALQRQEQQYKHEEEKERYVSEHHEAKRILAELEQERLKQEELDRNDNLREGPPPPRMGK
jgi:hypothetical protein